MDISVKNIQTDTKQAKKIFSWTGISFFTMAAIVLLLQLVMMNLLPRAVPSLAQQGWYLYVSTFAPLYLVAMPITAKMLKKLSAAAPKQNRLKGSKFFKYMVMCIAVMYIGNILGILISNLLSSGAAQNPLSSYMGQNDFFQVLVMVVLAPVTEELFFRKLLIDRVLPYGEGLAILISGLMFGLFHMNLFQFFYAFGLGAMFAYVYVRTGRVAYSISMHMIINFIGSVLAPFIVSLLGENLLTMMSSADSAALTKFLTENPNQASNMLIYCAYILIVLTTAAAGVVLLIKDRKKAVILPTDRQLPNGKGFSVAVLNPGMIIYTLICLAVIVMNIVVYM